MATQLQIRRGTSTQVAAFTGAEGEIVVNTTNDSVHVNDGSTQGGFELARVDGSNWAVTNSISIGGSITTTEDQSGLLTLGRFSSGVPYSLIRPSTNATGLEIRTFAGNALARFLNSGVTELYHNASLRLSTTSTGIALTSTGATDLTLQDTDGGFAASKINVQNGGRDLKLTAPQDIILNVGSSDVVTILNGGNFGIGLTNPATLLDIAETTSGTDAIFGLTAGTGGRAQVRSVAQSDATSSELSFHTMKASNTSEAMRINPDGYVNAKANVAGDNAPDTQGLHFGWNYSNGAGESLIVFNKGAGTTGGLTFVDNSSSGTHVEVMRLESRNLLVGRTSSLAGQAESISSDTVVSVHGVLSAHQTNCGVMQYIGNAFQLRAYGATAGTGNIQFRVGGGGNSTDFEAARIASNGSFLFGQTANDSAVAGTIITQSGVTFHTRDGNVALVCSRLTSDGDIVQFRKGSTAIGVIQTKSSQLSIGTGDTGIQTNQDVNAIIPHNTTTNSNIDNTIDLGYSAGGTNFRFKNLYLSGGVHFSGSSGGISTANRSFLMDEYEIGTCTIGFNTSNADATLSRLDNTTGFYQKTGEICTVHFYSGGMTFSNAGTGSARITGLPFNSRGGTYNYGVCSITHNTVTSTDIQNGYSAPNNNFIILVQRHATAPTSFRTSGVRYFMFSITYLTA